MAYLAKKYKDFIEPYIYKLKSSNAPRIFFKFPDAERLHYILGQAIRAEHQELRGIYRFKTSQGGVTAFRNDLNTTIQEGFELEIELETSELETFAEIGLYLVKNKPIKITFPFSNLSKDDITKINVLGYTLDNESQIFTKIKELKE